MLLWNKKSLVAGKGGAKQEVGDIIINGSLKESWIKDG